MSSEQLQDPEQVEEALGILKDDKEFEEFEKENWLTSEEEISDLQVWDDKWDYEVEIDDQFTQYLRQELTKLGHLHETN
uniref:26S proteasome complex subunit SEM1 n=1 Tax=Schistosoma mansoni TaxID=6183 RepID=A0AA82N849_SCHMA